MSTFKDRCRAVNERSDIVAVAMHLGMEVRTQGSVPYAHCPFHGDTGRMNLAFYQEPGDRGAHVPRAYCFACKTHATTMDLVMQVRHFDIFEALDWLASLLGLSDRGAPLPLPVRHIVKPQQPVKDKRLAVDHSIRRLWDETNQKRGVGGDSALQYLRGRGLPDEIIREYQLGDWGIDASGWSGRFIIPYLERMERDHPVYTLVGGRVRRAGGDNLGQLLGEPGAESVCPGHQGQATGPADTQEDLSGGHAGERTGRPAGPVHAGVDRDDPKYRYTKGASRKPYLWDIALARAEREGYLIITEGELDGLSVLSALGGASPVTGMGGVGAISAVEQDSRLAGLDILYVADLEAPPRWGTEYEEQDALKLSRIERVVASSLWKLKQLNANVRLVYPPSINTGKTDVNDLLMAYGVEGLLDWLLPELDQLTSHSQGRVLM